MGQGRLFKGRDIVVFISFFSYHENFFLLTDASAAILDRNAQRRANRGVFFQHGVTHQRHDVVRAERLVRFRAYAGGARLPN